MRGVPQITTLHQHVHWRTLCTARNPSQLETVFIRLFTAKGFFFGSANHEKELFHLPSSTLECIFVAYIIVRPNYELKLTTNVDDINNIK